MISFQYIAYLDTKSKKHVKVEGEVLIPWKLYQLKHKNEKVSDLLAKAGMDRLLQRILMALSLKRENIAILGIDKNKSDTTEIAQRAYLNNLTRLKKTTMVKTLLIPKQEDVQPRNNYVGIDLLVYLKSPGSKIDLTTGRW